MAKNLDISLLLDFYGSMLTQKQREMTEYYYNDDLSLAEIAENEGITRQGVRDSIKRGEAQLFDMEDRLGLLARFHRVQEGIQTIAEAAQNIQQANERFVYSREITASVEEILKIAHELAE